MEHGETVNKVRNFSKRQRKTAVIFGVFSLIVVIFMMLQIRNSIRSPFMAPKTFVDYANKLNSSSTAEIDLRQKDSDGDGLSDYDEMYVYHSSPYLEDSDSDGFTDKQEVLNGTDPNCPAGQTCSTVLTDTNSTVVTPTASSTDAAMTPEEAALQNVLNGNSDTSVIRKLLLDNGMDKDTLNAMSDEELMTVYNETLNQ